jgi:hypothetical protein
MAFGADVSLLTVVQESQDAQQLRIWDESTWDGESGDITGAILRIQYYDSDGVLQSFDNENIFTSISDFLDRQDGIVINLSDLLVAGAAPPDRFVDGFYIVTVFVTDGTYGTFNADVWPHYHNNQAFLAKARFMTRKLPSTVLTWPMSKQVQEDNLNMLLHRMYLDSAEYAADNGNITEFKLYLELINEVFSYYELESIW